MDGRRCKGCGRELTAGDLRYVTKVDIYAAYDQMEIGPQDMEMDHSEEIRQLLYRIKDEDPKQMSDDVYVRFIFDLCKQCKEDFSKRLEDGELLTDEGEAS